jgi:hypothetical protein
MANNLAAFNSQSWSKRLIERLNQINVMVGLVNRNWEGDLRNNASVVIRTAGNISFSSYSRGGVISYQNLTPIQETFTVSDGQLAAFNVDDIDKAQSDISAMDVYLNRTVVALNNVIEAKLTGAYSSAAVTLAASVVGTGTILTPVIGTGTLAGQIASVTITAAGTGHVGVPNIFLVGGDGVSATATVSLTSTTTGGIAGVTVVSGGSNYTIAPKAYLTGATGVVLDSGTGVTGIYSKLVEARSILGLQGVPATPGTRWAVIDTLTSGLLLSDTAHFIRATDLGDRVVQEALFDDRSVGRTASSNVPGFIGQCMGFSVYESNHIPTSGSSKFIMCGNNEAISYASQITLMEMLRLQTTVADAARCLLLHDKFVSAENSKRLVVINAQGP